MKEIDWSKAPEGATHFDSKYSLFCTKLGWWSFYGDFIEDKDQNEWGTARYIERPGKQWTGTGFPPVGTVCEVMDDAAQWNECTVLAHHDGKAVFVDLAGTYGGLDDLCRFRPIRTPDQIAAEEREKAVDEMMAVHEPWIATRRFCEKLYDAGYRRQEPKE